MSNDRNLDHSAANLNRRSGDSPVSQKSFTAIACLRTLFFAALLLPPLGALQGCAGQMHFSQSSALANGKIKLGMSRGDVIGYLGPPQKIETLGSTEFFFYTPVWYILPLFVSSQNPVAIRDGKVVGMGQSDYNNIRQTTGSL
ncbi:MAG TPA: hypothetical protein VFI48_03500 [Hyphomicrobiaceae bacterium]|nr:hypothetical protein [Hyphomicrobiaceae bacterium]